MLPFYINCFKYHDSVGITKGGVLSMLFVFFLILVFVILALELFFFVACFVASSALVSLL